MFGIAPLVGLGMVLAGMAPPGSVSFAEVFSDYPVPDMVKAATLATIATAVALIACLGLIPAWKHSGWPLLRKLNYSLFALAYATTGFLFVNWGLVPYWP